MPEMRRGAKRIDSLMILGSWAVGIRGGPGALPFWPVMFAGKMGTFCPPRRAYRPASRNSRRHIQNGPRPGPRFDPRQGPLIRRWERLVVAASGPRAGRFDGAFLPDAVLARLGHDEDGDEEHDGRHH